MKFSQFVKAASEAGRLVVQPRMGFADVQSMRGGLEAVSQCLAVAVGTITLDSYTRVGDHASARDALQSGQHLNGYPIVAHGAAVTRTMLGTLPGALPIQVRHGSAKPQDIFKVLRQCGVDATEGGPISYCLPYGRTPLRGAIEAWAQSCRIIAAPKDSPDSIHLESFGGCMLGQLCPPSLLIAISIIEGLFFIEHGVFDLSLSYAQQTHLQQDVAALNALRRLAGEFLGQANWHVVLYTYMGVFPRTHDGAQDLLAQSVNLAFHGHAERLIVKTTAEAHRIPTVAENIEALQFASQTWSRLPGSTLATDLVADLEGEIYDEALSMIHAVLNIGSDLGNCIASAFDKGYLDVPFCLHADNRGHSRSYISQEGLLRWHATGKMPIKAQPALGEGKKLNPYEFLSMLSFVEARFDQPHLPNETLDVIAGDAKPGRTRQIAIIGCGPRSIAVLERLVLELEANPPRYPLKITVIDAVEPGAGRVWRTDQSPHLLMNTITSQITLYSGALQSGAWRAGAGPNFHQWLQLHSDPQFSRLGANDYAPRQLYGQYLRSCFSVFVANLQAHANVSVLKSEVTALTQEPAGFRLQLREGQWLESIDTVILATGHARVPQPTLANSADAEQAASRYIAGDSAADMPLEQIAAGQTAAVIGMGLGFYDLVSELTVGRGGRFVSEGAGLRYVKSGLEPLIIAGTRSGMPILARAINQKPPGAIYQATFATARAIERARVLNEQATGSRSLDFNAAVRPLLQAEMEHVYYATALRNREGEATAQRFILEHARDRQPLAPMPGLLLQRYGLADLPLLELNRLARPFGERIFDDQQSYSIELTSRLQADVAQALLGNLGSPVKAALDVLRDVRDTIRQTVEGDGLTQASRNADFFADFAPACALLSAGPPVFRTQQLLALLEAGVVNIVGPQARFTPRDDGAGYHVDSPRVAGYAWHADWLIDSRIRTPLLETDGAPLYAQLLREGHTQPYRYPASESANEGLHTDRKTFALFNPAGAAIPGLFAIGIPTEGVRWFTQVGSATPGVLSRFTQDAITVAQSALGFALAARQAVSEHTSRFEESL
ncbi:FAD/NAD(P)-binding protein [Pseudomonas frederiksbergensis]|uniref:FAD-dependent urate hydroxylase HpyO/Asp monooxygenase CreE-like FAD/NAD(P)-binding domain-containing protein n=1 Tax=Pseudomonas frederiksbergensis TaxID=104087 RepID=A0A423HVT8_9PSED|nr:FAD/NAD(P)-binding protein [Pseudomonas frederiksbergensis]RON17324.1 hypothetical protein BK662_07295 [Pseudomonas frederiksbergensis]